MPSGLPSGRWETSVELVSVVVWRVFGRIREFSVRVRKRWTTAVFELIISPSSSRGASFSLRYEACDVGTVSFATVSLLLLSFSVLPLIAFSSYPLSTG